MTPHSTSGETGWHTCAAALALPGTAGCCESPGGSERGWRGRCPSDHGEWVPTLSCDLWVVFLPAHATEGMDA